MSIVWLKDWRERRAAEQLAQALSGDPVVRAAARIRDIARLLRIQKRLGGEPAQLVTNDALEQARQRVRERAELAARRAARRGEGEND